MKKLFAAFALAIALATGAAVIVAVQTQPAAASPCGGNPNC